MSSSVPTVRQVAWISIIPQLLVMGLIITIWYQFDDENPFIYGALTYIVISQLLRRIITKSHRLGVNNVKVEKFQEAIPYFENSYDYFEKNNWIDKYRYLTLLSSSKMSYKEMALNNIAFCYSQIGKEQLAKEYYQKTLTENPENGIAKAALRMLSSIPLPLNDKQQKN